jgi:DNA repair exonuclease SbcCD nuclease subunit
MRFLHTSDWHLGRIFHGLHMTDDQAIVLEELIALVKESNVDAVLIAGDIYDRAVPPTQAVTLLDEVLRRLVQEAGKNVIMPAITIMPTVSASVKACYLRTSFISPGQSALLPSPLYYMIPTGQFILHR